MCGECPPSSGKEANTKPNADKVQGDGHWHVDLHPYSLPMRLRHTALMLKPEWAVSQSSVKLVSFFVAETLPRVRHSNPLFEDK
jgi:hypothetical protein